VVVKDKILIAKTYLMLTAGIFFSHIGRLLSYLNNADFKNKETKVLIEAGIVGWDSVFYSEFKDSLKDYINPDFVKVSQIDRSEHYLRQVVRNLNFEKPTHFCIDPRTGAQKKFQALFESLVLSVLFGYFKIVPIVILTDASIRTWRFQSIVLTAGRGVIVTFLNAKSMGRLFPHKRVIGPIFMPVSQERLRFLEHQNKEFSKNKNESFNQSVFFLGSLYPKRAEFFESVNSELNKMGSKVQILVESKSSKVSVEEYWKRIVECQFLISTGFQQESSDYKMDRPDLSQLVFRVSEALSAGKFLFSTSFVGVEMYFVEDVHFVSFRNFQEAAQKIEFYSKNPMLAKQIAISGRKRMQDLTSDFEFWKTVDRFLQIKIRH
jgi:hypothetical protein